MKKYLFPLLILILFSFSCSRQIRDDSINDYSTTGFITDSCFQVVIQAGPDPSARSLTERRDSALRVAREHMQGEIRLKLNEYFRSAGTDIESRRTEVEKRIEIYASKGYTVCEYYLEDAEAVIVYRICSPGLKREMDEFIRSLKPASSI